MKTPRYLATASVVTLALSLAACGSKGEAGGDVVDLDAAGIGVTVFELSSMDCLSAGWSANKLPTMFGGRLPSPKHLISSRWRGRRAKAAVHSQARKPVTLKSG